MTGTRTVPPVATQAPRLAGTSTLQVLTELRRDPLPILLRVARECGPVGQLRIGPRTAVVVSGPEAAREVLVSRAGDFSKGRIQRRALRPTLRDGLLISEGSLHERQRRLVAPHFTARRAARYVETMALEAVRHADSWADGQRVDLLQAMGTITRDVIGRLLFSAPLDDEQALADGVTRVFEWEMHALLSLAPAPLWVPTARNRGLHRDLRIVRDRIGALIAERRESGQDLPDLLGALLAARYEDGGAMDPQLLLDEVITLWGAAHETSADAQFWTAYLLARHPQIAARVQAEADDVLGDRMPTDADLSRLPYSLQVFKEAMRLYPPAASMLREAVRDTTIGGHRVPRGAMILVAPWALHRNPDLYPDPERFDPGRFEAGAERDRHRFAYLPFGAGPHVCIGSYLALTEGQVFTSVIARRVEFDLEDPREVEPQLLINLRPRTTVTARISRRAMSPVVAR